MFTRDQYIASVQQEANILKHLYTKLKPADLAYRPTKEQRSMQELIEFLPCNLAAIGKHVVSGDWSTFGDTAGPVKEAAKKDFAATVDRETSAFIAIVKALPESDLTTKNVTLPNGVTVKLGQALVEFNLKFLAAYRMQLFLYLKSCGHAELVTSNLWRGQDPAPKK